VTPPKSGQVSYTGARGDARATNGAGSKYTVWGAPALCPFERIYASFASALGIGPLGSETNQGFYSAARRCTAW
jgi:hypothetical protein